MAKYLERTNYFNHPWEWVKRSIILFVLLTQLFQWNVQPDLELWRSLVILLCIGIAVVWRKADIAVDHDNFYHLRTSLLPMLSKKEKYKIDQLINIRGKGYESWFWALYRGRSMVGTDFGIEMDFKDGRSKSLDINIYKKDLDRVLKKTKELIAKKSNDNNTKHLA